MFHGGARGWAELCLPGLVASSYLVDSRFRRDLQKSEEQCDNIGARAGPSGSLVPALASVQISFPYVDVACVEALQQT